jgi:hypothetical protein
MFLPDESFASHMVFVMGLDAGTGWGLLEGFREFLLVKIDDESSLAWPGLVLWLVEPVGHKEVNPRELAAEVDRAATARMYQLLDEFLAIRHDRDGLAQIFGEYLAMLQRHGFTYENWGGCERRAAALRALAAAEGAVPVRRDGEDAGPQ